METDQLVTKTGSLRDVIEEYLDLDTLSKEYKDLKQAIFNRMDEMGLGEDVYLYEGDDTYIIQRRRRSDGTIYLTFDLAESITDFPEFDEVFEY